MDEKETKEKSSYLPGIVGAVIAGLIVAAIVGVVKYQYDINKQLQDEISRINGPQRDPLPVGAPKPSPPAGGNEVREDSIGLEAYDKPGGKYIVGTSGEIDFKHNLEGHLTGSIHVDRLPNGTYLLCLNGEVGREGNELFAKKFNNGEGYYDFPSFKVDAEDTGDKPFDVRLKAGDYNVKVFVKDMNDDYKVVLYNDELRFTVR